MTARKANAPARAASPSGAVDRTEPHPRVGWVARGSVIGRVVVDWSGNSAGPVAARTAVTLDSASLSRAVEARQPVVLLFEGGDAARPIVAGLLQSSAPLLDELLSGAAPSVEVRADRRRVITAVDELELRCGTAVITLRRNGRIVIEGAYVETRAKGTNRIKGGTVKIN